MTPKQQEFCRQYLLDLNATQAAIRAGYSAKTADRIGSQNLGKLEVQKKVSELMAERAEALGVNSQWVLDRLIKIAEFDIRKLFDAAGKLLPTHKIDDDTAYALAGIDITEVKSGDDESVTYLKKFKVNDRIRALELIGRHLGMFTDRIEHSGNVAARVTITMPDNGRDKTT